MASVVRGFLQVSPGRRTDGAKAASLQDTSLRSYDLDGLTCSYLSRTPSRCRTFVLVSCPLKQTRGQGAVAGMVCIGSSGGGPRVRAGELRMAGFICRGGADTGA